MCDLVHAAEDLHPIRGASWSTQGSAATAEARVKGAGAARGRSEGGAGGGAWGTRYSGQAAK